MKRKKKAFTVIEMIITLAITVMIIEIVSSIFITGNKIFSDSDIKSTLQIEAQKIQETISEIGMEAVNIESISKNQLTNDLEQINIVSYYKSDEPIPYTIKKEENKLMINDTIISANLKSIDINDEILNCDKAEEFKKFNSITFNIELSKKKGYSDVIYPINFTVKFRNKN